MYAILFLLATIGAQGSQSGVRDQSLESLAPLGDKPAQTLVTSDNDPLHVEVKFRDGVELEFTPAGFLSTDPGVTAAQALIAEFGIDSKPAFTQSREWLRDFRERGQARSRKSLHDLTLFYSLELPRPGMVGLVCDALNALPTVELAYPLPRVSDPVMATAGPTGVTPSFEGTQGYRRAAPLGIDADYGNTFNGGAGLGTTIVDVEFGWTDDHEDLAHQAQGNFVGLSGAQYPWDHGTQVLGILSGANNESGVRGVVYDSDILLSTHQGNGANIPTAIMNAVAAVGTGDTVLLEVQCVGGVPSPYPCEFLPSVFATVQAATANGIHVFTPSGNGGHDLDEAFYNGLFDRTVRDSGAVFVGASNGSALDAAIFSNYGSRVDLHGWGANVTTTGVGDLQGGLPTQEYTANFNGTSSAASIVTGAGVILNSVERATHGTPLDPFALRDLMVATGTPQGSGGQVGPRPDIRAAIDFLNLPRIEVTGTPTPGAPYTVTSRGPANSFYALVFSNNLRVAPWQTSFGQLFLARPWGRVSSGILPANGEADFDTSIPNDSTLAGTTFGYYQGWQRESGSAQGTFANYAPIAVQ